MAAVCSVASLLSRHSQATRILCKPLSACLRPHETFVVRAPIQPSPCSLLQRTTSAQSHTALTGVLVWGLMECHQRLPGTAPSRENAYSMLRGHRAAAEPGQAWRQYEPQGGSTLACAPRQQSPGLQHDTAHAQGPLHSALACGPTLCVCVQRCPHRELEVMEAMPQKNWPSRGMIMSAMPGLPLPQRASKASHTTCEPGMHSAATDAPEHRARLGMPQARRPEAGAPASGGQGSSRQSCAVGTWPCSRRMPAAGWPAHLGGGIGACCLGIGRKYVVGVLQCPGAGAAGLSTDGRHPTNTARTMQSRPCCKARQSQPRGCGLSHTDA